MKWTSAADSHKGNHRSHNEDAVFCSSDSALWLVADGMGGHNAGEIASAIAEALVQQPAKVDGGPAGGAVAFAPTCAARYIGSLYAFCDG